MAEAPSLTAVMAGVIHHWGEASLHRCGHKPLGLSREPCTVMERVLERPMQEPCGFRQTRSVL